MLNDNKQLMIQAIRKIEDLESKLAQARRMAGEPIAVIGMACRFPGDCDNPDSLWDILVNGKDVIGEIPEDRWEKDEFFYTEPETKGKMYTRCGGFLKDIRSFDAQFFGISPREARELDPQQRILIEVAYEALENAGQPVEKLKESNTGVFTGISSSDYSQLLLSQDSDSISSYMVSGNSISMASGRLSYLFGFHGPSFSVDTACSSSMVAIHQACMSLRNNECDMAVSGGVNVIITPKIFISYCQSRVLSPDGRCKTFDDSANGFARSEGCGALVLKRLSDAKKEHDPILAVIKGSAVNHDGRSSGLTVPNGRSQSMVIERALENACITAGDVSLIEAHGTGTALGDPIEIGSLRDIFGDNHSAEKPLYIGSVKTNIGHLEAASGIAGVMKAVLCLKNKTIPAHLHLKKANTKISWDQLPFCIPLRNMPWKTKGEKRIAGVSSFGLSGTNVHVILEEADASERPGGESGADPLLLTLSAKTEEALKSLINTYTFFLEDTKDSIKDICYTASTGRSHFNHRVAAVCRDRDHLREALAGILGGKKPESVFMDTLRTDYLPKTAFIFSTHGYKIRQFARELADTYPAFKGELEICDEALKPLLKESLMDLLYFSNDDSRADPDYAVFSVEYILAKIFMRWGIKPGLIIGEGLGRLTAACVSGIMSFEDAVVLAHQREKIIGSLCTGKDMTGCRRINGDDAFNSREILTMIDRYNNSLKEIRLNKPDIPVISGRMDEITRFSFRESLGINTSGIPASMEYLKSSRINVWMELGTGPFFSIRWYGAQDGEDDPELYAVSCEKSAWEQISDSLAFLYVKGVPVEWNNIYDRVSCTKVVLPNYPFQRTEYWMDGAIAGFPGKEAGTAFFPPADEEGRIISYLVGIAQKALDFGSGKLDIHKPLIDMGFDSITALHLNNAIKKDIGAEISMSVYMEGISLVQLSEIIDKQINGRENTQENECMEFVEGEL